MAPLDCGRPDPRHHVELPLTERQLDGWRDAAETILAHGMTPILPVAAQRALWRRSGTDRELAERLHQPCKEAVE